MAALLLALSAVAPAQIVNPAFVQSGAGATARTFLDKAREHVSVKDFGARCDGTTNDSAPIAAAVTASAGRVLHFPVCASAYRISSTLTVTGAVAFDSGAIISPDADITATLNGEINAPSRSQIFSGAGSVVVSRTANPKLYEAWFSGKDIGAKINAAIHALGRGPGTVMLNCGSNNFSTMIDAKNTSGIRLTSDCGNLNSVSNFGPVLTWTGGAGSGSALTAVGSRAFEFDHINLTYNSARYNGSLMTLSAVGGLVDTSATHVHHARLAGQAGAADAARLIELGGTLLFTIDNTTMDYATVGIGSSAGSNNVISIGDGMWFDKHFTDCAVKAWGANWRFGNFVAESDPKSGVPLTTFLKLAGETSGIAFNGGLFVDGGNGSGTLLDLSGAASAGISLQGIVASAGGGTFFRASLTAGATSGLSAHGNIVSGMTAAFDLGRAEGVTITGNTFATSTTWSGAEPTRYFISNNKATGLESGGVSVPDNANVALTPPGSPHDGAGLIVIYVTGENATAIYALNGSAGATTEIADPSGIFSNTVGTASSINIYWDAGTRSYRAQNKRGGKRNVVANYMGR